MMREHSEREVAKELDELRARLSAAQLEEAQRRKELEDLRKDFARLSEQLRRQRAEHERDV
jgi:hypothetical protein